ncbi:hypothetical protein DCAR_0208583 [Daucus carota subsp. sativus]|uniref:Uncharacterized protein n=1 Tax=Daucus carota subsp. sativus TaxID=79200 RepID=A0A166EME5_DAUCS|nr:hypothetical protein DCAR_0208583 [Daucus carota subsp. sativus]
MAIDSGLRSTLLPLFLLAMVLSPALPAEAARLPHRELLGGGALCVACVCCTRPPPGKCCAKCCASPIVDQSRTASP